MSSSSLQPATSSLKVLFIGDIVGQPGVAIVAKSLPIVIPRESIDLVIANAENASGGAGMSPGAYRKLLASGVDVFTMGDHIYKRIDVTKMMAEENRICKPANYPPEAAGQEFVIAEARNGTKVAVISLIGRLYMRPADCPLHAADRVLNDIGGAARCVIVDFHAEATGEKAVMGRYLDGRVAAVLGTHTHVPTADEQILPGGTAFITDVGMTGPYSGILGRRADHVTQTGYDYMPRPFDVAEGDLRLAGAVVELDVTTGKARAISRFMMSEDELTEAGRRV